MQTTTDTIETAWGPQRMFVRIAHAAPIGSPVIVLVHGLGVSSRYMLPLMHELAAVAHVFAPDLPGFGCSQKPKLVLNVAQLADVLASWMKARGLASVCLLGNSMGCQVAVNLAERHPELCARLVLVGPTMDASAGAARQVVRWLSMAFVEPLRLIPVILRDYLAAGFFRTYRTFRFALQDKIEARIRHVVQPVLIVRGRHDRIVREAWAETVAESAPHGRMVTVPSGAHAVNFDAPRALGRIIKCVLRNG